MANIQKNSLHTINYSASEMAQKFDGQYFKTERYKVAEPLDINTESVGHSNEVGAVYKTLLHRMRNIAKTNYTVKEVKEKRRPRIQYCGYKPNGNENNPISLCKSDRGSLFFNGLANCGGYWRCPVCALKISENKKELLAGLITQHQEKGLTIGFITLTVRHKYTDRLKKSLEKLLNNFRLFQTGRFFKEQKKTLGYIGMVRTLEVTFSKVNGWHPHLHLLFFYDNADRKKIEKFQKRFISDWAKYKDNDGLVKSQNQQILTQDISDYVSKYDITSEMTKGNIKGSKGLTPFTALGKIALQDYENHDEKRLLYGIYSEFVEYTQGRAFVFISRDLRKEYSEYLDDKDKTDDEIVNEVTIDEVLLKITLPVWKLISKNDLQPLILNKYKENNLEGVYNLLIYFKDFKHLDVEIDKHDIPILTLNEPVENEE